MDNTNIADILKDIQKEVHENNILLKAIANYLANQAINSNNENFNDFIRNIMANLISSSIDINNVNRVQR